MVSASTATGGNVCPMAAIALTIAANSRPLSRVTKIPRPIPIAAAARLESATSSICASVSSKKLARVYTGRGSPGKSARMSGPAAGIRKMAETNKSVIHSPGRWLQRIKAASGLAMSHSQFGDVIEEVAVASIKLVPDDGAQQRQVTLHRLPHKARLHVLIVVPID